MDKLDMYDIFFLRLKQDKVRKSLRDLQPSATDKENLVGSGRTLRSSQQFKDAKNKM